MKRFFCSVCQQVKRVRKYPTIIETPDADKPSDRVGVCNFHEVKWERTNRMPEYAQVTTRKAK